MSRANINDTFFEGIYQDVWRKLIHPGLSEAECDFIEETALLHKGDRVLDLMCGYGRHTVELGRRGYQVTAVDNLPSYVAEIKSITEKEALPIEAIATGVLNMGLVHNYKAAICMGNSFAFFSREDAVTLLKNLEAHLQHNGILLINSWMIAEIAIKHFREKDWCELDGFKYLMEYRFHFHPSRIESEHTIISEQGIVETIQGVDYIFTLAELEAMFNEAGLMTKALYGTPRKKPFKLGDNRIYIVAEKMR
jgi:SAM-dependent methyltransferase